MLNLKSATAAMGVIFLFLMATGCTMSDPHSPETTNEGSLLIHFSLEKVFLAKTIVPDVDMQISDYTITCECPEQGTISEDNVSASAPFETSLPPGDWTITVEGKNSAGAVIGSGTEIVSITSGQATETSISISPLPGNGYLAIDVNWPDNVLSNPAVTGTITPEGGTAQAISFTMAGDNLSASYGDSLSAGYYQISILLEDNGEVVWGRNEAARIAKGGRTSETYSLVEDVNNGGLTLTLVDSMQHPIDITLDGFATSINQGQNMTVTATHSGSVDGYQWYLQGQALSGETGASITLGSNLNPGTYWLDVVVQSGDVYSSEGAKFAVN